MGGAALVVPESVTALLQTAGNRGADVPARLGDLAAGTLHLIGARQEVNTVGDRYQSLQLEHPLLTPLRAIGIEPVLAVRVRGGKAQAHASAMVGGKLLAGADDVLHRLQTHASALGWTGLDPLKFNGLTNQVQGSSLVMQVSTLSFGIGGFLRATGSLDVRNRSITFDATAIGQVPGLGKITVPISRGADGSLVGGAAVDVTLKGLTGQITASFGHGLLDVQGVVTYHNDKFDGQVTLVVTDKESAKALTDSHTPAQAKAAGAVEGAAGTASAEGVPPASAPAPAEAAAAPTPGPAASVAAPKPGPRVVAGWGTVTVQLADWLSGEALVVVDHLGDVTLVGKITPRMSEPLFPQRDYIKAFPKLKIRAAYGIPVVGNIFLFAGVGLEAVAKIGPATLDHMELTGTWSTKPEILKSFGLTATLNISAFAGLRLTAQGGAGVEILDHDIKAGVEIGALAGIRGYVEATPRIAFREVADPQAGKRGEFYLGGHLELAAQPFLQLSGDLFVDLDSPWWSPAPDKRWNWPIGSLEYPLPGEFGIGADVEHVLGSGKVPEISFGAVDFNAERFLTDLVDDHVPPKKSKDEQKKGSWKETGQAVAPPSVAAAPPTGGAGETAPSPGERSARTGAARTPRTPAQEAKWQAGLKALRDLAEVSKSNPQDEREIRVALASIKKAKGFRLLEASPDGDHWDIRAGMSNVEHATKISRDPRTSPEESGGAPTGPVSTSKPEIPIPGQVFCELPFEEKKRGKVLKKRGKVLKKRGWALRVEFTDQWIIVYRPLYGRSGTETKAYAFHPSGKRAYRFPKPEKPPPGYFAGSDQSAPTGRLATARPLVWTTYKKPYGEPPGWRRLADRNLWHRAHLINGKWGGPGESWNLVPVPAKVNTRTMPKEYENDVHERVREGKPTWFKAKVEYHKDDPKREIKKSSDFAHWITVSWGPVVDLDGKREERPGNPVRPIKVRHPRPDEISKDRRDS